MDYIEIKVSPSTYPVNYKGEYHYRSGSNKQQYRGAALTEFIMQKTGYRWDAVPVDNITVDDLDPISIDIFKREAVRKKRMNKDDLDIPTEELMDHLDLIYTKYLKAKITYEHDVRVETYPFPREGVREAIYNALGHINYAASVPIQIRIEDEAMYISNSCILPPDWTVKFTALPSAIIKETAVNDGDIVKNVAVNGTDVVINNSDVVENVAVNDPNVVVNVVANDSDVVANSERVLIDGSKSVQRIADELGISQRQVQRIISDLKNKGLIVRHGADKNGYWEVKG